MVNYGKHSDSFADHFSTHLRKKHTTISAADVKPLLDIDIIKQLDPITASKRFGFDDCSLCMNERVEIIERMFKLGVRRLVNKNMEIYGACRHKAKFHTLEQVKPLHGTDEGKSQKKNHE